MIIVIILLVVALAIVVGYAAWQRRELRANATEIEKHALNNDNLQIENETLRRDKAAREARLELVLAELRVDNDTLRREKMARESSLVMVLAELDKSA